MILLFLSATNFSSQHSNLDFSRLFDNILPQVICKFWEFFCYSKQFSHFKVSGTLKKNEELLSLRFLSSHIVEDTGPNGSVSSAVLFSQTGLRNS